MLPRTLHLSVGPLCSGPTPGRVHTPVHAQSSLLHDDSSLHLAQIHAMHFGMRKALLRCSLLQLLSGRMSCRRLCEDTCVGSHTVEQGFCCNPCFRETTSQSFRAAWRTSIQVPSYGILDELGTVDMSVKQPLFDQVGFNESNPVGAVVAGEASPLKRTMQEKVHLFSRPVPITPRPPICFQRVER